MLARARVCMSMRIYSLWFGIKFHRILFQFNCFSYTASNLQPNDELLDAVQWTEHFISFHLIHGQFACFDSVKAAENYHYKVKSFELWWCFLHLFMLIFPSEGYKHGIILRISKKILRNASGKISDSIRFKCIFKIEINSTCVNLCNCNNCN